MIPLRRFLPLLSLLLACLLLCSALLIAGLHLAAVQSREDTGSASYDIQQMDFSFNEWDRLTDYNERYATHIHLEGDHILVDGAGAEAKDGILTIGLGGVYVISGELADGRIQISAPKQERIHLIFDGVSIHCEDDAPLYIRQARKVILTLADGSQNMLSDGADYLYSHGDQTADGAVFSRADLSINGGGSLTVQSMHHGIVCKDSLVISGPKLSVTAQGQGISGKDCVKIQEGSFQLDTQTDAIQSDNQNSEDKGFIYIAGGEFIIRSQTDAIQAETVLRIDGGRIDILTNGGSENVPASLRGSPHTQWSFTDSSGSDEEEEAVDFNSKGLKARGEILICGGVFSLDTFDDAIHANGNVRIDGGDFSISTGDDGIHADGDVVISGGAVSIPACYEGIEGTSVTISGGEISVTASDDCINAAPGKSAGEIESVPKTSLNDPDNPILVRISGGTVSLDAEGDGIDTNGDLYLEGGAVTIFSASYIEDTALDYDGVAIVTGGTLVGVGSGPWAQGFGHLSTQYSCLITLPDTVSPQVGCTVEGPDGSILFALAPPRTYQSVVYTSPDLRDGQTITFRAGEQSTSLELTGISSSNEDAGAIQPGS